MKQTKELPGYKYIQEVLYNPKGKKVNLIQVKGGLGTYKVKNYENKWINISKSKISFLFNEILKLPNDAKAIPNNDDYFADTKGNIYSFSRMHPSGKILSPSIGSSGYLYLIINGKRLSLHSIVANTFIMNEYTKHGLCCMHKDNNKLNCKLDNLCIGTYSQNNKDAYKDGLNNGNRNKCESGEAG